MYVASIFIWMLHMCSGFTHMLQAYVCKCFIYFGRMLQQMLMLQVLHDQAREVGVDGGGPLKRAGREAGAMAPTCMRSRMCTAAAGGTELAGTAAAARQHTVTHSNSTQTGAVAAYGRAGRSCMHALWARLGKARGRGAVHASLSLAACIHESESFALFSAARRRSASGVWTDAVGVGMRTLVIPFFFSP
jgi:hypothetical protein